MLYAPSSLASPLAGQQDSALTIPPGTSQVPQSVPTTLQRFWMFSVTTVDGQNSATLAPPRLNIEPTYCRKHAEFGNGHPDAPGGPNRPETAKKAIDQRRFEKSRCCRILSIYCMLFSVLVSGRPPPAHPCLQGRRREAVLLRILLRRKAKGDHAQNSRTTGRPGN